MSGAERLGIRNAAGQPDLDQIRLYPQYTTTRGTVMDGTGTTANTQGYTRARRRYIARQNSKSVLAGIKA